MNADRDEPSDEVVQRAVEATLALPVPDGPSPQLLSQTLAAVEQLNRLSRVTLLQRIEQMPWLSKATAILATAASILIVYMGVSSFTVPALAFADVVKALEGLRSATYDFTSEIEMADGKTTTSQSKGYFLAPALERVESLTTFGGNKGTRSIMILDCLAAKGITLLPEQKMARVINISTSEPSVGGTASMFEMVRRLVREGASESDKKIEMLGKKEIDNRPSVGFRTKNNMADITVWADPETGRLVRVEFAYAGGGGHAQMSNFHYDLELDPSLFSLEPPAGYDVQTQTVQKPVEEDLVRVLRLVAEHNDGVFPDSIGMTEKSFMLASQAAAKEESEKLLKNPDIQERMKQLKAQYGDDPAAFMKAWMKEWMELAAPITQKNMAGLMFYSTLQPENDSHYAGKGVKLGAPNTPIFWYKPTGADKYRVIFADLTVQEVPADKLAEVTGTIRNEP